jgi:hypothetical protein
MYCPKCGRNTGESQRFCTGCGTKLVAVGQTLAGQQPAVEDQRMLRERVNLMRHGIRSMFIGLGIAVFFLFFSGFRLGCGVGLLWFFIGLGRFLASMLAASPRLTLELKMPSEQIRSGDRRRRRESPPMAMTEPPYITEQTTVPLEQIGRAHV